MECRITTFKIATVHRGFGDADPSVLLEMLKDVKIVRYLA